MSTLSNINSLPSVIARPDGGGCTDPIFPIGPKGGKGGHGLGDPLEMFTPSASLSAELGSTYSRTPREGGIPEPEMGIKSWWDDQVGKVTRWGLRMIGIRYNVTSGEPI